MASQVDIQPNPADPSFTGPLQVKVKLLDSDTVIPTFAYPGDVAVDLRSTMDSILEPFQIKGVPTGLAIELPTGLEAQVRPRSGLALKHGVTILNTPGTIDTEYRGEIVCIMVNLGLEPFTIKKGDRIAQLAIRVVPVVELVKVDELTPSKRGAKGLGSSGTH